mgnify:CR=1 FL=1
MKVRTGIVIFTSLILGVTQSQGQVTIDSQVDRAKILIGEIGRASCRERV